MGRLDGKVALITGAAKGLGEADARLFINEGAKVVLADVDQAVGEELARQLGSNACFKYLDVTNESQWQQVLEQTVAEFGGLHILVNNAGIVEMGNIVTTTTEQWRRVNAVSSDGTFFGCKYAMPYLEREGGSIVNMASIASIQGEQNVTAYCAAKGAVEALSRAVAVYCAQSGNQVRCNSIHPSGIDTPMVASVPQKMAEVNFVPDQNLAPSKIGEANDVAYMVLYLASDEAKFVNGTAMRVDNTMSVTAGVVPGKA